METTTIKEVEGAMPVKNEVQFIRALDTQGNPAKITPAGLMKSYGNTIPLVSQQYNGLLSKNNNIHAISTNQKKYVFLHKTTASSWSTFSFLLAISAGVSGCVLMYIYGGIGQDNSRTECRYSILANSVSGNFNGYGVIKYKINEDKSIEIYLVAKGSESPEVNLGGRNCTKMNFGIESSALTTMSTLEELNVSQLKNAELDTNNTRTFEEPAVNTELEAAKKRIADLETRLARLEAR